MLGKTLPIRFQIRASVQALVNGLRRPTSDPAKLLRLADGALGTLDGSAVAHPELRGLLGTLSSRLRAGLQVDRARAAAELARVAAGIDWRAGELAAG